jgi:diphosphoinositol-polyphosphate diphosphatase
MDCSKDKDRSGRARQRHDAAGCRLVVGTVPFTATGDGPRKVLLINSSKYPDEWVLPKGGWEDGETAEECALRETWEEAGCTGTARALLVADCAVGGGKEPQRHTYFAMEVAALADEWPERKKRGRKLVELPEARVLLAAQQRRKDRDVQLAAIDRLEELDGLQQLGEAGV